METDVNMETGVSEARVEYFPPTKPWREQEGRVRLIGMRCASCGTAAFPTREVCSGCGRDDALSEIELAGEGKLYSFSEVHAAPKGFATPYVIGYVDLTEGVRVLAQIDGAQVDSGQVDSNAAGLRIGQDLVAKLGPVRKRADGTEVISYRFTGAVT
jgi:uncharacterized OB-fold protein